MIQSSFGSAKHLGKQPRGLGMKDFLVRILTSERFIVFVILVNAIVIFLQESGLNVFVVNLIDVICTFIFLIEMIVKHIHLGVKEYWKSKLNCMDGILVLISLPSVLTFFWPDSVVNLSFLLVLRVLRIFRFFRLVSFFPYFTTIVANFKLALRQSNAVLLCFFILIITVALIGCCIFKEIAPEYFATPLDSIYSTFRLFTVEGWYDIPDAVARGMSNPFWAHVVRFYFCFLLLVGGIIGMSLINSIFVDAMVSDNNDELKSQLDTVEAKLNELIKAQEKQTPETEDIAPLPVETMSEDELRAQIEALSSRLDTLKQTLEARQDQEQG